MFRTLMDTKEDYAALVLRVAMAVVFFPHGAQKLLGWFGGHGFSGTMDFFTQTMGIPAVLAVLVIIAEFFGSIGLFFGFLTRLAAFGIGCVMAGAVTLVHWQFGFFMNWNGNKAGEGFEFHLLAIAMAVALMIKGGGAASIDRAVARKG